MLSCPQQFDLRAGMRASRLLACRRLVKSGHERLPAACSWHHARPAAKELRAQHDAEMHSDLKTCAMPRAGKIGAHARSIAAAFLWTAYFGTFVFFGSGAGTRRQNLRCALWHDAPPGHAVVNCSLQDLCCCILAAFLLKNISVRRHARRSLLGGSACSRQHGIWSVARMRGDSACQDANQIMTLAHA